MFQQLTDKLDSAFKALCGRGKLTEKNIKDGLREVRTALLEADVNYKVARDFIKSVQTKAVGTEVLQSIDPGQQIVKIVNDELIALLGGETAELAPIQKHPTVYMVCGLQGAGKTTLVGKLALQAKRQKKKPLVVAADIYRPAAIKQLEVLAKQIDVPSFTIAGAKPPEICAEAFKWAEKNFIDLVIFDTAGRLHVDDDLMAELEAIAERVTPDETLLVVDAMTGQDAVNVAGQFSSRIAISGVAVTKLDGDARGGAALSIRQVTGVPIKLASVGEKLPDLEPFHPSRMASRILGMGDVVSLVEKAQETIDADEAVAMQQKLLKAQFDFEDFLKQMEQVKKLGPLDKILGMIPGAGKALKGVEVDEREMERTVAIIKSMTPHERRNPRVIDGSRKRRIAAGSGNTMQDVNALLKQFQQMQKMFSQMNNNRKRFASVARRMG